MPVLEDFSDVCPVSTNRRILLSIDVIQIATVLNAHGLIDERVPFSLEQMQLNGFSSEQTLNYFLQTFCITNRHPIDSVLEQIQNSELRCQLQALLEFARSNTGRMPKIWKIDSEQLGHRRFLNNFYRILKKFHNDPKNSYEERLVLFNRFEKQISRAIKQTSDPEKQMHLIDKQVVLIAAYIDFLTIKYKHDLPSYAIFEKLRKLNYQRNAGASSTLIPDIVFCQRKGIALAIAGEFDKGEELINHFEYLICNFDIPCREFGNKCYFKMYFNLWKYEKYPTEELKQSIIKDGEQGLAQDGMCSDDSREFWKAPLLIKMIYCLLGIGNRGNPFSVSEILDDDIKKAEEYIGCISFRTSSMRREMQLLVAKARICELKLQNSDALRNLATAKSIALQGQYEELNIIAEYQTRLKMSSPASSLDWSGLLGVDSCEMNLLYGVDHLVTLQFNASSGQQDKYNNVGIQSKRTIMPVYFPTMHSKIDFDFKTEKGEAKSVLCPSILFDWSELLRTECFELNDQRDVVLFESFHRSIKKEREFHRKYIFEIQSKSNEMPTYSTRFQNAHLQAHGHMFQSESYLNLESLLKNCPDLTNYERRTQRTFFENSDTGFRSSQMFGSEHYSSLYGNVLVSSQHIMNDLALNYEHEVMREHKRYQNPFISSYSTEEIEDDKLFGDYTDDDDNDGDKHYFGIQTALYNSNAFQNIKDDSLFNDTSSLFLPLEKYKNAEEKDNCMHNYPAFEKSDELPVDMDLRFDWLSN